MFKTIREDIKTVFAKDPAARSSLEIIFCYNGLHAIWAHRINHFFWTHHLKWLARYCSNLARMLTGVEIHPGAKIGRRCFIDHGTGIVIGETSEIGDDVLMYQGCGLIGTSTKKEKRHPTIGNCVEIGAGAFVMGAITVGDDVRIGAGSVVIKPVPPGVTVVGVPARVVTKREKPAADLEHGQLPDPVAEVLKLMIRDHQKLNERLKKLERLNGISDAPEKPNKKKTGGSSRAAKSK
ncbi:MAG: serine O-acetyltransferase [Dehalococcoidales bacterium]|nr:serine O-acetyltransferase [Dehalococcoidales bacterium]